MSGSDMTCALVEHVPKCVRPCFSTSPRLVLTLLSETLIMVMLCCMSRDNDIVSINVNHVKGKFKLFLNTALILESSDSFKYMRFICEHFEIDYFFRHVVQMYE